LDEQGESRWLGLSGVEGEMGENSHGDSETAPALVSIPEASEASRPMPGDLMQRVGDTANMIELLIRDLWTQAELEAEGIRESAHRQAESIVAEAQRTARRTLDQARDRADVVVGAAKMEATKVAVDAERLAREFMGRLSSLVTPSEAAPSSQEFGSGPERPDAS